MKRRKLNIDPALIEYAEMVLKRDGMPYCIDEDGSIVAYIDEEEEEILIEDAMCEEQRLTTDPEHPVYSARTIDDHAKLVRLQRLFYGMDAKDEDMQYREFDRDAEEHLKIVDRNRKDLGLDPVNEKDREWFKSGLLRYTGDEVSECPNTMDYEALNG